MKPVFQLPSGGKLTKGQFTQYLEKKVYKTIEQFDLIKENDHVGVAISGGKDSLTVLSLINRMKQQKNIQVSALAIDEGIAGYRDKTLVTAKEFCDKQHIKLHVFSYTQEFGMSLDRILKVLNVKPCTICGIFRRYLLNKKAKELGFSSLATGHNLDDEAQSIFMNQMRNDLRASARLGPSTGLHEHVRFVPRIKPLYFCTEKEITTYAFVTGMLDEFTECPNVAESFRAKVRDTLNDLESKYPGTKYGIVRSFVETLPSLKEKYRGEQIGVCQECGEPASKTLCNACKWSEKLKKVAVCEKKIV